MTLDEMDILNDMIPLAGFHFMENFDMPADEVKINPHTGTFAETETASAAAALAILANAGCIAGIRRLRKKRR